MAPTRIYVRSLLPLLRDPAQPIHALAHITGGGLVDNVPRILPGYATTRAIRIFLLTILMKMP